MTQADFQEYIEITKKRDRQIIIDNIVIILTIVSGLIVFDLFCFLILIKFFG